MTARKAAAPRKQTARKAAAPAPAPRVFSYQSTGGSDPQTGKLEPVHFQVQTDDGVTDVHTRTEISGYTVVEFMGAGTSKDPLVLARAVMTFFEAMVEPSCWPAFQKAIRHPSVSLDRLFDMAMYIAEEVTNRPT